jgi:DnaA-homolog protein
MIQLSFPLISGPVYTFDNLIIHEGVEQAVSTVRVIYGGKPPHPNLLLCGPPGVGKTHVLQALLSFYRKQAHVEAGAQTLLFSAEADRLTEIASQPEPAACALGMDDIHLLPEEKHADLYNLLNRASMVKIPLFMTSAVSIEKLFPSNPHLTSRLLAGLVFKLLSPPDAVRVLILDKMAADRNIRVTTDVYNYLVTRKTRNIKELERIVEILDRASLAGGRRITVKFIKTLEQQGIL